MREFWQGLTDNMCYRGMNGFRLIANSYVISGLLSLIIAGASPKAAQGSLHPSAVEDLEGQRRQVRLRSRLLPAWAGVRRHGVAWPCIGAFPDSCTL
eukprot:s6175_g1.t1